MAYFLQEEQRREKIMNRRGRIVLLAVLDNLSKLLYRGGENKGGKIKKNDYGWFYGFRP
jgi:hypothetical protein